MQQQQQQQAAVQNIRLKFMPNTWKDDRIIEMDANMYYQQRWPPHHHNDSGGGSSGSDSDDQHAAVASIVVTRVIYAKKNLAVLDCLHITHGRFCMKLRRPYEDHVKESEKYVRLSSEESRVSGLFPKLFALIQIPVSENCSSTWGGICMEMIEGHSLVDLLFVKSRGATSSSAEVNRMNMETLTNKFNKKKTVKETGYKNGCFAFNQHQVVCDDEDQNKEDNSYDPAGEGGMYIRKYKNKTFDTTLIAACLKMLHKLHKEGEGWVHGDTHLGNFIFDPEHWRLYLVDMERSFPSNDPIQHMLDIQELVGHASGLLVSYPNGNEWNMKYIWGVATKLHPLLRPKKRMVLDDSVLHMLPVCVCFIEECEEERKRGCACCKSEKNHRAAISFTSGSIQNFFNMSLKRIRHCVHEARKISISEMNHVRGLLLLCKQDIAEFLAMEKYKNVFDLDAVEKIATNNNNINGHYGYNDDNDNDDDGSNDDDSETNDSALFEAWMQKIMYWGAFFPKWKNKNEKLIRYLQLKGNSTVCRNLQFYMPKIQ
jgi:hypothetical protein